MAACWRALADVMKSDLLVIAGKFETSRAPGFNDDVAEGLNSHLLTLEQIQDYHLVSGLVTGHRPDVVVICGYATKCFMKLAADKRFERMKFIAAVDTPLKRTLRQRLARLKIGAYLDRMSAVIVAGERSLQNVRRLGVARARIYQGMYGANCAELFRLFEERRTLPQGWPKQFLFVGRYSSIKGVDILLTAYQKYRREVSEPWSLVTAGDGEMRDLFINQPGITNVGFVQPKDLPQIWQAAGVFVLPSRYEPWGVVIAEAAASGLPVICSNACGSAVDLVRDLHTGRQVATGSVESLLRAMCWMHHHHSILQVMGKRSQAFAAAYSAEEWAHRWLHIITHVISTSG